MKKIFLTTAFAVFTTLIMAQSKPRHQQKTPEQIAQHQANRLSEKLSLTEAQRSKAYNVYLDQAKKREVLMNERRKEMQKLHKQEQTIATTEDSRIEALLNADQKKSFQVIAERHEDEMHHPHFGRNDNGFRRGFAPEDEHNLRMAGRFRRPDENFRKEDDFNRRPNRYRDDRPNADGQNHKPERFRSKNGKPGMFKPDMENRNNVPDSSRVTAPDANPIAGS